MRPASVIWIYWFDNYFKALVPLFVSSKVPLRKKVKIFIKSTKTTHPVETMAGFYTETQRKRAFLRAGEVVIVCVGIKGHSRCSPGDTITHASTPDVAQLKRFSKSESRSLCGCFPVSSDDWRNFRVAWINWHWTMHLLFFEPESFWCPGVCFRCGSWYAAHGDHPRTPRAWIQFGLTPQHRGSVWSRILNNGEIVNSR